MRPPPLDASDVPPSLAPDRPGGTEVQVHPAALPLDLVDLASQRHPVIPLVIPPGVTRYDRAHHLDGSPDLSSENGTLRDGMDGRGSTSNP
jgi:hypothetical protein